MAPLTLVWLHVLELHVVAPRGSTHYGCAHYPSQFAATRAVLLQRPRAYYERLLLWLITPHDSMHTKGDLAPSLSPPLTSNPHPFPQP